MDNQWCDLSGKIKRYLSRMLKRPEDIEDITQEAFARVLEAGSKGEIRYNTAYLYRTAHNLALNSLARKSNLLEDYIEDFPDLNVSIEDDTVENTVAGQQRLELFCRTVSTLPEQCRRVLVMRKVYGLSQKEVAERLGISVSTVEKHVAKGLLYCSEHMQNLESQDAKPTPVTHSNKLRKIERPKR